MRCLVGVLEFAGLTGRCETGVVDRSILNPGRIPPVQLEKTRDSS